MMYEETYDAVRAGVSDAMSDGYRKGRGPALDANHDLRRSG